jgi:hypothetical protein
MKKICLIIVFIVFTGKNIWSQSNKIEADTITLKELEIPNSPAFILLDQTPSTIERPNSSKAFALSILNSFQDSNGVPKNYAVDFTPFWFFKHPNMTSLKYAGYNVENKKQHIFGNIERASISFALITTTDTLTQKVINNLSVGLRLNLISIRSKQDIEDIIKANSDLINYLRDRDDRFEKHLADIKKSLNDNTAVPLKVSNPLLYSQTLKEFYEKEDENEGIKENGLKDILARKSAFAVDGAIGYNNFYLDNKFSNGHFGRFGAWLTLNYSWHIDKNPNGKNYFNLYAIGRYLSDGTSISNGEYQKQNFYDFGGKAEFEFKKISLAYEYIYRDSNSSNTFRSNGLLKYKISDNLFLTGAFGKNFGLNNNLISMLGINWGLSTGTEKATTKETL